MLQTGYESEKVQSILQIFSYMLEPNKKIWQFFNNKIEIWWVEENHNVHIFSHFGKKNQTAKFSQKKKCFS
jgi:hypothetical protein